MSRQFWNEGLVWTTADATAVANTTTETTLFSAPTIPANYLQDGRTLRLTAYGKYSTTGTPTMIFTLRYGTATGGVVICKTAACTTPTGVTNAMWAVNILLTVRSNGAAGTVMGNGTATVFAAVAGTVASATGEALVTPMTNGGVVTPAAATCDLTADTALTLTLTWSAASASNTATGLNYMLESLN
jgi:hypothetical protein